MLVATSPDVFRCPPLLGLVDFEFRSVATCACRYNVRNVRNYKH